MSAPTKTPAEQATQLIAVSDTLPRGSGLSSEHGVWLMPATVAAAVGQALLMRVVLPETARVALAVGLLVAVVVVAGVALLCARVINR